MKSKNKIKIILVAGARPNFMKIAPLIQVMRKSPVFKPFLAHTGQHYDEEMSELFFDQLEIPEPDINLGVGSGSHAVQTAKIMERFEKVCLDLEPNAVLVVGDVNSTAACTLVSSKLNITTIHYEAGLRSRDKTMPEEINRMVTDSITDIFFTTSKDADKNLIKEGHRKGKIHMCGNLMIDNLNKNLGKTDHEILEVDALPQGMLKIGQEFLKEKYGLLTFHRPSNVDSREGLKKLVKILIGISKKIPLVFPVHPRTWKNIGRFGLDQLIYPLPNLLLIKPIGYLKFLFLMKNAEFVMTDSGGIQEETTFLNIPCLTVRNNTERPVTIWQGSNKLINLDNIQNEVDLILRGKGKTGRIPKYWDGHSAERIVKVLFKELNKQDR